MTLLPDLEKVITAYAFVINQAAIHMHLPDEFPLPILNRESASVFFDDY